MNRLVVTCHPNGSLQTTLKDKVFNTAKFGKREIERVSQIRFNSITQRFVIEWLKGPRKGCTEAGWDKEGFETYDEAVEFEVDQINIMRLIGHSFV